MGQSEMLAQRTFAEETERTTGGAAGWQDPPEIRLDKVQGDGFLVIRRPHGLAHLPAPWPEAQPHGEVMIELKLAGNHLDREAVERALLRRQARQLQRVKEQDASWRGHEPLWLIAPHLPQWLDEVYAPVRGTPGVLLGRTAMAEISVDRGERTPTRRRADPVPLGPVRSGAG